MLSRLLTVRVRWVIMVVVFFLITMTLLRYVFYWRYHPADPQFTLQAFILGFRYDLKFSAMAGAGLLLLTFLKPLDPFRSAGAGRFWNVLMPLVWVATLFMYVADFFHFDYLQQRLNASVLNYLEDISISAGMVFQSYPVVPILAGILLSAWLGFLMFRRLLGYFLRKEGGGGRLFPANLLILVLMAGFVFGKWSQYPLRWSDAFTIGNNFSANLALNPLQSFFSTLKFRGSAVDMKKVRSYYPLMADLLGVKEKDPGRLNFTRIHDQSNGPLMKPNIVLVICESFSAYKTGIFGNPLRTTPFFDSLTQGGVLFDRCFTPSYGTARGVWAIITGIPDVEHPKTASRNPAAVDQRSIINDFADYERFYFIGGDPSWANIQGLLSNNIRDLRLYMQNDFPVPKIDVWGISDKNLFLESNKILREQKKPFFAVIQTADNHRPYSIPEDDRLNIDTQPVSADTLRKYGFDSKEQLYAFRYTDYCFRVFMNAAKQEDYFNNTLFVFVGDHGIPGNAGYLFPAAWTEDNLTCEHVPLFFYAPHFLQPARESGVCSQLDVLPSLAGLARIPYRNHTLGRNLFDSIPPENPAAFIVDHDMQRIGLVTNDYCFMHSLKNGEQKVISVKNDKRVEAVPESERKRLKELSYAWYETARYMMLNNKKNP